MCEKGCSHVAGYSSAQCGGRWDGTRCPAGGIGVPAVQCVWHVGKHATRIAYPNARGSLLHMRDDKFVIKVSRQALYPGHTLGGAQSVHCKPELAGSLECCARCVAKRTLAIGITCGHVLATGYWNPRLPGFPG